MKRMEKNNMLMKNFLDAPTAYHAAGKVAECLKAAGYVELSERDSWNGRVKAGMKGFVMRNGTAVVAFDIPKQVRPEEGLVIGTAHTDCPLLRLRIEDAESIVGGRMRIPTDIYGGAINSTWLDRPLGISGVMMYDSKHGIKTVQVESSQAMAIVPNPPPHLQRGMNSGEFFYGAKGMAAIVNAESMEALYRTLTPKNSGHPVAVELYLHDAVAPQTVGDLISAQHLDNLTGCWAVLQAMTAVKRRSRLAMGCFFNNEEVGSVSSTGAAGSLLADVFQRIMEALDFSGDDARRFCANGRMASVDAAHAYNPNFPELFDVRTTPQLGRGIVLKTNVNLRYATTCRDEAEFVALCARKKIAWQKFQVPANSPCGSTVGPALSAATGISCLDLGVAMWAMHSIRETASCTDIQALSKFMIAMME